MGNKTSSALKRKKKKIEWMIVSEPPYRMSYYTNAKLFTAKNQIVIMYRSSLHVTIHKFNIATNEWTNTAYKQLKNKGK